MSGAAAAIAALGLAAIAAIHVFWGMGGRWPAHDDASLAKTVIGSPRMAPAWACLAVACALAAAAVIIVARPGRIFVYGIAAVLLARGFVGMVEHRLRAVSDRYARLNVTLYSPLALVLGAATLLSELA